MRYRREIDGLRALAILPVILFHAGFQTFSGGFIGVDVFFVISGYLITSLILLEKKENTFSLKSFYERRARRILPALFFVMLFSLPFAWFLLLPNDMEDFSKVLWRIPTFISNTFFYKRTDYFDGAVELKPFIHTWSLGIEEQFYLFFPILLIATWRLKLRSVISFLIITLLCSLAWAQYKLEIKPNAAFYLLTSRFWELLIGALVAFYLFNKEEVDNIKITEFGSAAGLGLLAYGVLFFNRDTPFPGLNALVPTIGAALIILYAKSENLIGKLLGSRLLVGIGLISYSAYLWHQPIFAFVRINSLDQPSQSLFLVLIIMILLVAYLSWKYIENPFRNKTKFSSKQVFIYGTLGSLLFISLGLLGQSKKGFEVYYINERVSSANQSLISFVRYDKSSEFRNNQAKNCFFGDSVHPYSHFNKDSCWGSEEHKKNYLLIGDSHAAHLYSGLIKNFPNINIIQASLNSCRPLVRQNGSRKCKELMSFVFDDFIKNNKIDGVILSGRWRREDLELLSETVSYLSQYTSSIIVFGPTIEYKNSLPLILLRYSEKEDFNLNYFTSQYKFTLSELMKKRLESANINYISVVDVICPKGFCSAYTDEQIPITWDYGHYTVPGSVFVIKTLKDSGLLKLD